MARLVKSFIGGIASKVTGTYEEIDEEESVAGEEAEEDKKDQSTESQVEEEEENGLVMNVASGGETEKVSLSSGDGEVDEEESSEQDDLLDEQAMPGKPPSKLGQLSKWTNYLLGWQERYVVVREGILSYYKSEFDLQFGCRGSISLHKVRVLLHEFDDKRFDIRAHDCTYFFRAESPREKEAWMDIIEINKKYMQESGFGKNPIPRQGSLLSLSGMSQASTSSFQAGHNFNVKLAEIETYRDILCKQIDLLQLYYDSLLENSGATNGVGNSINASLDSINDVSEKERSEDSAPHQYGQHSSPSSPLTHEATRFSNSSNLSNSAHNSPISNHTSHKEHRRTGSDPFAFKLATSIHHSRSAHSRFSGGVSSSMSSGIGSTDLSQIDFRGEAITFKATTAGIVASITHCIELMNKREEYWKAKFEKEQERRRKAEKAAHSALNGPRVMAYEYSGPDFQEGPHSTMNEEEFFDALEMAYHEDEVDSGNQRNGSHFGQLTEDHNPERTLTAGDVSSLSLNITHKSLSGLSNRLTPEIDKKVDEYSKYIFEPVDSTNWVLVHEDGDMKVHRRELEEDGVVVDPLKAKHLVKGISAYEMAKYFFDPDTRFEWEGTIEKLNTLEVLAEDSMIFHHLHKRVWPSTQRETVFLSHHCTLQGEPKPNNMIGRSHLVCNFSLEHPSTPVTSKLIRAVFTVTLVCQTIANKPVQKGEEPSLTRDDISCLMIYAANVNPGGWAPPSVVRTIAKREITKFLKKFSSACCNRLNNTPLTL